MMKNANRLMLNRISINTDVSDQNTFEFVNVTFVTYLKNYLGHYVSSLNVLEKYAFDHDCTLQIMSKSTVTGAGKIILARLRSNRVELTGVSTVAELFDANKVETLYLWFLFMNRPDMAKYLCSRCQVSEFMTSFFLYQYY